MLFNYKGTWGRAAQIIFELNITLMCEPWKVHSLTPYQRKAANELPLVYKLPSPVD